MNKADIFFCLLVVILFVSTLVYTVHEISYENGYNDARQEAYCSDYCYHNTWPSDTIDCVESCNNDSYSNQWRYDAKEVDDEA